MYDYGVYIGVDVSKGTLAVSPFDSKTFEVANTANGISSLIKRIKKLKQSAMVCCEATGGYESPLVTACLAADIPVAVANPKRVRDYAKGQGVLAKTDAIDAAIIAGYAQDNKPRLSDKPEAWREAAIALLSRREDLMQMLSQEKNRLSNPSTANVSKLISQHIAWIEKNIKKIEAQMDKIAKENETFAASVARIDQIKGCGKQTAMAMLVFVPEIGKISDNEATALVGVAPYCDDSGTKKGKRRVACGRKKVRRALYMAAVCASNHNPILKAVYDRLVAKGKLKKVAIVTVMRRLVILINRLMANPDFKLS